MTASLILSSCRGRLRNGAVAGFSPQGCEYNLHAYIFAKQREAGRKVRAESEFYEVNGTRLHCLRWPSQGQHLIILHGNGHCGGVYEPLGDALSPDFDVLALDLRGHGLSAKEEDYSWATLRDDVLALVDRLGWDEVVLVAHSRGGGVALLTAAALGPRARAAVAYEPTVPVAMVVRSEAQQDESAAERAARLRERVLARRATFADREDMYSHFKGRGAFAGWRDDFLRAYIEHGAIEREDGSLELSTPPWVEGKLYEAMPDLTEWLKVEACDVPVLAIYGERGGRISEGRDPLAPLRAMFPRIEMTIFPDCTHSGPMEHPELFEAAIRKKVTGIN